MFNNRRKSLIQIIAHMKFAAAETFNLNKPIQASLLMHKFKFLSLNWQGQHMQIHFQNSMQHSCEQRNDFKQSQRTTETENLKFKKVLKELSVK